MPKREFLMLAHTYKSTKHKVKGWYASEKLDGIRALWDGGISRGLPKTEIPFANQEKDARFVRPPVATGLWTRYGNVIHCPDRLLDQLPDFPLDGELFTDRRSWQDTSKIVKTIDPDSIAWEKITYNVFNIPHYRAIFETGTINDPNFRKEMNCHDLMAWAQRRGAVIPKFHPFRTVTKILEEVYIEHRLIRPITQWPINDVEDVDILLRQVLEMNGEGLMMCDPNCYWEPRRSHVLVKLKPELDDEAVVTGYVWGRKTDKGSKFLGMMGALVTQYKGRRFELSGFKDAERQMFNHTWPFGQENEGFFRPGEDATDGWYNPSLPIGTVVTFTYRELSDTGVPKEGRFLRKL